MGKIVTEKIKAIITGSTGMVGEGVLHECLLDTRVQAVLVINRKPCGVVHPKLKEVIQHDFFDVAGIEKLLTGYNACFFCLGVSSLGLKEPEYARLTHTLTLHFAQTLSRLNTNMTFCYVSGAGTRSSEKGGQMWARVKGKTENDLRKLPFKQVFAFRPGYMQPTKGLKNTQNYYKYLSWMYPFFRKVFPGMAGTLAELGQAMINAAIFGYDKPVLEVKDIAALSVR
jgi:uncharacterized protein YbjT (DUF2867 family)